MKNLLVKKNLIDCMCAISNDLRQNNHELPLTCVANASSSRLTCLLQLRYAAMVLFILTIGVGNMWGADVEVSFATWTESIQNYDNTEWTDNGCSFTFASNNQKNWAYVRCGCKGGSQSSSTTSGSSTIKYNTKVTVPIKSVVLNTTNKIGNGSSSSITITGIEVSAYSDASFSSLVSSKDLGTLSYTISNCPESFTITPTTAWTKDKYYKITISWTVKGTKNCGLNISGITFKEDASTCTPPATALSISSANTVTMGNTLSLTTTGGNGGAVDWSVVNGTGSATVSGSTLTPTGVGTVTVTATQGENGGKCGAAPTQTITISNAPATIKLSEAGAESTVSGTHYSGDSYTLPSTTEAVCGTKVLVGWSTVTIAETDTKPTSNFYEKGESVTLSAGENKFYAVFATASAGGTKWVLTSLDAVTAGTYAIVNQSNKAFNGTITDGHGNVTEGTFTFTNGEASSAPSGTCEVTFEVQGDGFSMYNTSSSKYLYASKAGSGGLAQQDSKPTDYWNYYNPNWQYHHNYSGSYARLRSAENTPGGLRVYGNNSGDGVVKLAKKTSSTTYSAYSTSCAACTANPTVGTAQLKGSFNLSNF